MTISTCSYAGWHSSYGVPVRITLGLPRQPEPTGRERWLHVHELCPRPWYIRSAHWAERYTAQVDRMEEDIMTKIAWLEERYGEIVLVCFERRVQPGDCHRLIAAERIGQWLGREVPELDGRR